MYNFFPLDLSLITKFSKHHFLQDISNSCHEVTIIGLEPHPKNFGQKISTILSLDVKGGAADVQVVL